MIDPSKLRFLHFSEIDDFSILDFKQFDGSDPLGVDKFIHEEIRTYLENPAFKSLFPSDVDSYLETKLYPALLIGKIGIDKGYRGRKMGQYICSFCSGIGQELHRHTGCAFLILRTTASLARRYYAPRFNFKWKAQEKGNVWMYRRLF